MDDWIDSLAGALGEEALTDQETARLLSVARDVAHRVERKVTPPAAFVLGCAVGRDMAGGATRSDALASALESLEGELPQASPEA